MSRFIVGTLSGPVALDQWAEAIQPLDRRREYAIRPIRAVEGGQWGTSGDGLELPTQIVLRLYLARGLVTRAQQRAAIDAIEATLAGALSLQVVPDARTYSINRARLTLESPTYTPLESYVLELTFWPGTTATGSPGGPTTPFIPDSGYY